MVDSVKVDVEMPRNMENYFEVLFRIKIRHLKKTVYFLLIFVRYFIFFFNRLPQNQISDFKQEWKTLILYKK